MNGWAMVRVRRLDRTVASEQPKPTPMFFRKAYVVQTGLQLPPIEHRVLRMAPMKEGFPHPYCGGVGFFKEHRRARPKDATAFRQDFPPPGDMVKGIEDHHHVLAGIGYHPRRSRLLHATRQDRIAKRK